MDKYTHLISSYLLYTLSIVKLKMCINVNFIQALEMLLQTHKKLYRMKNNLFYADCVDNFELKV